MIYCNKITKSYGNVRVLLGIDIDIPAGQIVSIIGASGAGKSTLLHILGTLENADDGVLELANQSVSEMSIKGKLAFRNRHIGFVFQFHHLLPEFTAVENVMLPSLIAGVPERKARHEAKQILDYLGMLSRLDHKPGQMSGGEQQRVALARALINRPKILLADEPTGNLDQQNAHEVVQLLLKQRRDYGTTTVIVTHDPNIAQITDKTFTIKDGRITDIIERNR